MARAFFSMCSHLNVVISVVMKADDPVKLGILRNVQFCVALGTLGQGLAGIFFHLDKEEFSVSKKNEKLVMSSFGKQYYEKFSCNFFVDHLHLLKQLYVVVSINVKG